MKAIKRERSDRTIKREAKIIEEERKE